MTHSKRISLDLERHTLDNGLRIVLHRDSSLPLVALNLWYHVGSRNESRGRTGFAHLFEHLLFQGSANVAENGHFHHIQQAGGTTNGSTWYDRTNYHATLPAHFLDLGLWLESDRMGFFLPAVTQEKLDNQRDVVINERHQRVDNQPYGQAFERLHELLYPSDHPYSWPVIGYEEDLRKVELDEVRRFFQDYYVPSNAVLTLAGDFDPPEALAAIERFFAEIPPGAPPPPPKVVAAPQPGTRREVLPDRVRLPRIYLAYNGPRFGTDAWYAADLQAALLCEGKSSVLYRDLVYDRELAQDVSCFILPTELSATFACIATARPGVDPAVLEEALDEHLRRAVSQPPDSAELDRARNQLLTSSYSQLQSLERRADLLSRQTCFFDSPERVAEEPFIYERLTGEDIFAFNTEYLKSQSRALVLVVPDEEAEEATTESTQDGGGS